MNSSQNLINEDNNSAGDNQFSIDNYLEEAVNYIVLVTTEKEKILGDFKIIVTGPGAVTFHHLMNS